MAQLSGRLGVWNIPSLHRWSDRTNDIRRVRRHLIDSSTRIATIGSCFAEELALAMDRLGLQGALHPGGLFYTSASIRQELAHLAGETDMFAREPRWSTKGGWVHPFRNYARTFPELDELESWSDSLDRAGRELFIGADVVVVTLGLIEAWLSPTSGAAFRQIPHPDVFPKLQPQFHRLQVHEIQRDLFEIRRLVSVLAPKAALIVSVSPIPLHSTFTDLDVRVANAESKARIRAAVSQCCETTDEITYFPSYEMVAGSEHPSDFMREDGRHVKREGVDLIVARFMQTFARDPQLVPPVDDSWLRPIDKTVPSLKYRPPLRRVAGRLLRR
jgi:hypothetical protein